MDILDLSRKLSPRALLRLARSHRKKLIAGISLAGAAAATFMLAAPALADESEIHPTPSPCATGLPLTTPCAATVVTGVAGAYSVTLPGIGVLDIMVDPTTNLITTATFTLASGTTFTASAVTINEDANKASVTVTSADGNTVYNLSAKVKPSATGAPTVTAKVKTPEKEDADETEKPETAATATPLKAGGGEHNGSGGGDH